MNLQDELKRLLQRAELKPSELSTEDTERESGTENSSDLLIQYRTRNAALQKTVEKLTEENAAQSVLLERQRNEYIALQDRLLELDKLRLAMSPDVELNISTNQEQAKLHIRPFLVPMNYEEVELLLRRLESILEESYKVLPTKKHTLTLKERDAIKWAKVQEERSRVPEKKPVKKLTERKALSPLEKLAQTLMKNLKISESQAMEQAQEMFNLAQGKK